MLPAGKTCRVFFFCGAPDGAGFQRVQIPNPAGGRTDPAANEGGRAFICQALAEPVAMSTNGFQGLF